MMKLKRGKTVVLLMLVSILALAGCGKKTDNSAAFDKNTVYKEEALDIDLPENFEPGTLSVHGNDLYVSGYSYDSETYESSSFIIVSALDGSETKTIPVSADIYIDYMVVLDNGNILISNSDYDEVDLGDGNYEYNSYYYLSIYDTDGNLVKRTDLSADYDITWINSLCEVNGKILAITYDGTLVFDEELNLVKKSSGNQNNLYDFISLRDGSLIANTFDEETQYYARINPETLESIERIEFPFNVYNYTVMAGGDLYDILLKSSTEISGYNFGDAAPTPIFNFVNSDVSASYFNNLVLTSDNSFVACYYDWDNDNHSLNVSKFVKVDPDSVPEKKILTLGCVYTDSDVKSAVIKFNKSSDEYRIVIKDYSVYATEEDYNLGNTQFNNDIASGKAPDIIVGSTNGSMANYAAKGLFLDLNKYLDEDSDINRSNLFENVLEAGTYDDKLYMIIPHFYVQTAIAKTSYVGDRTGWNYDDYLALKESLPDSVKMFGSGVFRETAMYYLLYAGANNFVDTAKAKCYFDSEDFIKVLEIIKDMPVYTDDYYNDYDWEEDQAAYRNNKAVLCLTSFSTLDDIKYSVQGTFGDKVTYIGFPSSDLNGHLLTPTVTYSISSKCKYPEAAWSFVKGTLTEESQKSSTWGFPISKSAFDEMAQSAKEKPYYLDEDGNKVEYSDTYYIGGQEIELEPLTDEEIAEFKEFILSVNKLTTEITDIIEIITEEAAPYFEGQKTAEEVVKIIQSRVTIYLNEKQ